MERSFFVEGGSDKQEWYALLMYEFPLSDCISDRPSCKVHQLPGFGCCTFLWLNHSAPIVSQFSFIKINQDFCKVTTG
jgi:hypothetical protein